MVSPRTPQIVQKRYGPSEGRNVMGTELLLQRKRFEAEGAGNVEGEVFDYLRKSGGGGLGRGIIDGEGDEWEDVRDGGVANEEVFLQRALAAINVANQRGDGVVEMGEREWQAWKRHEAMEREIEKRVAEREMEREMQRERDIARAEELQRELDMLRRSGALDPPREPGFMVDQGFAPIGGAQYSLNSSSTSSLLSARAYPNLTPAPRQGRFMPDSTDPLYAQNIRPTLSRDQSYPSPASSYRGQPPSQHPTPAHSPAPSYLQPTKSAAASSNTAALPRRSSSRSSSLSRDSKHTRRRSITASTSVPPGADLAPGGSYHPGTHPSIPSSSSTGALGRGIGKGKGGKESEGEDIYSSASAQLKDARRRRRV